MLATTAGKCLNVMLSSIENYIPADVKIYLLTENFVDYKGAHKIQQFPNIETNFGDAYNKIVNIAFEFHKSVVVCNDDIVFTPQTWEKLYIDLIKLKQANVKLGYLGCRTDFSRGFQNIRQSPHDKSYLNGMKYVDEDRILHVNVISPVCAYIEKAAWTNFMPINFYSDDIQCYDMIKKGFKHFISSSYVHHVGSQTLQEYNIENNKAIKWIEKNRLDYLEIIKKNYGKLN